MKNILVQFEFPGVTTKQYDGTWDDARAAGQPDPKGLIHHTSARTENGIVVVDLWESAEAFKKFGEILKPSLKKNGFPDVEPRILPVYYAYEGVKEAVATH